LGSRVDRQLERWQELKNCCDDNVRRGAELVGGQGGTAPRFAFATLYRLRRWEESRFHNIFEGGQVLSGQDDLSKLFQPQR
jgi:hypothetical protein